MSWAQKGKIGIPWVQYEEEKWKLTKLNVQYSGGCGGNEVGHLLLQRIGGFSMMYCMHPACQPMYPYLQLGQGRVGVNKGVIYRV